MDYLSQYLPSNNVLALVTASLIFIVTVALLAKKLINFLITLVLLFFAIASGMAIAHNDLVRDYLKQHTNIMERQEPAMEETPSVTIEQVKEQLVIILKQLADALSNNKAEPTEQKTAPSE